MKIGDVVKVKKDFFIRASEMQGTIIGMSKTLPEHGPIREIFIVSFPSIPMSHDAETSPYRYFRNEIERI